MIFSSLAQLFKLSVFGKITRFGGNYVLSWILFPEDFGVLAVAVAYSQVILIMRTSGLQAYFMQEHDTKEKQLLSTVFFADLVMSLVLALLISGIAQVLIIRGVIELPVRDIMIIMGANILVSSLSGIYFFNLKKKLEFKTYSNNTIIADLISTGSKVAAAFAGFGALSFIFGEIFGSLTKAVFGFRFVIKNVSIRSYKSQLSDKIVWYIKHTLLISAAAYIISNFDKLILYQIAELSELGKYTFAFSQIMMLYTFFVGPVNDFLFSLLPKFYEQPQKLSDFIKSLQVMVSLLFVPFFAFLFFGSDLLIDAIYANRWEEAGSFMSILSGQFLIQCTVMCFMPLLVTQKRPDLSSRFKLGKAVLIAGSTFVTYQFTRDFTAIIYAFISASVVADLIQALYSGKRYHIDFKDILLINISIIGLTLIASFFNRHYLLNLYGIELALPNLIIAFLTFSLVCFGIIRITMWSKVTGALSIIRKYR